MEKFYETFGANVFNDKEMKKRLSDETYKLLRKTIKNGKELDPSIAEEVANAMKEWAMEKGATHYSHWFQPLTGETAEKHDSFIESQKGGAVVAMFSGKNLIKGEPDASSFPSGGLRDTFEARGYTAWDPTSYVFVKGKTLYIPTIFCSYNGEALDHKTPLLRSMDALNKQAMRILKYFDNKDVDHVKTTAGPEQEYFLIDRDLYEQRKDLMFTGRTLFGAMPPKGQEFDDHYFGVIKTKVAEFMEDLNNELWQLGVLAKTEHNEVAPAQHELATIFLTSNVSTDHNHIVMETMKKVAQKHGLVCLLHEKPFAGVNGSGKHNNWSIKTDTGINLLEPGDTPSENARFLLFLSAVIKAVDEYQDLLRISVATAANDNRLGASEAPPAIVSIFLGDELTEILEAIEKDVSYKGKSKTPMKVGVTSIPAFPKDNTDRNRTSPFAFTGNKFEFRMPGSSQSIATPNTVLNTAVAEELKKFADVLDASKDLKSDIHKLVKETIKKHKRIIFNGNGYDPSWIEEAEKRGLSNYPNTPLALKHYLDKKNVELYVSNGVLSQAELASRYEVYLETYTKTVALEARTMLNMAKKDIMPAVIEYSGMIAKDLKLKKDVALGFATDYEVALLKDVSSLSNGLYLATNELDNALTKASKKDPYELALYHHDVVLADMVKLRDVADKLEVIVGTEYWPMPDYGKLLFSVK
ncbi:MAG: glutamine synthetase III [Bacilli bacterium]|nr:glutamine synthetase III [Bacilli bacterium]